MGKGKGCVRSLSDGGSLGVALRERDSTPRSRIVSDWASFGESGGGFEPRSTVDCSACLGLFLGHVSQSVTAQKRQKPPAREYEQREVKVMMKQAGAIRFLFTSQFPAPTYGW